MFSSVPSPGWTSRLESVRSAGVWDDLKEQEEEVEGEEEDALVEGELEEDALVEGELEEVV